MIKDITIGQYFPGNSFIHKLDARAKLIAVFFALVEIFLCKNFLSLAVVVVFAIASMLISKISFKASLDVNRKILFLISSIFFLHSVFFGCIIPLFRRNTFNMSIRVGGKGHFAACVCRHARFFRRICFV